MFAVLPKRGFWRTAKKVLPQHCPHESQGITLDRKSLPVIADARHWRMGRVSGGAQNIAGAKNSTVAGGAAASPNKRE